MASLTFSPSDIERWQALTDDDARAVLSAVVVCRRATDDDDTVSHAVAIAAGLVTDGYDAVRVARAALRIARRHVIGRRLQSGDALDTLGALDVTDADIADAVDAALRRSAGRQSRLTVGHHGAADRIAQWTLADLVTVARTGVTADARRRADGWASADADGRRGKRANLTVDADTWRDAFRATFRAIGDPDPIGDPHPRHGRSGVTMTHTDAPTDLPVVTVRSSDGTVVTRTMTDAEIGAVADASARDTMAPADGIYLPGTTAPLGSDVRERTTTTTTVRRTVTPRAGKDRNGARRRIADDDTRFIPCTHEGAESGPHGCDWHAVLTRQSETYAVWQYGRYAAVLSRQSADSGARWDRATSAGVVVPSRRKRGSDNGPTVTGSARALGMTR